MFMYIFMSIQPYFFIRQLDTFVVLRVRSHWNEPTATILFNIGFIGKTALYNFFTYDESLKKFIVD